MSFATCGVARPRARPSVVVTSHASGHHPSHVRVCTNKTCKKQGSQQIYRFARDLQLRGIDVEETGCLGKCGSGPNLNINGTTYSYISTPNVLAKVLSPACGVKVDEALLQATELRMIGNSSALSGDLEEAISFWDQAIALKPSHGLYMIYSNRSAAKLTLGDNEGALEDAAEALRQAPSDFITAHIRKIDALYALKRHAQAMSALQACARAHPEYTTTKEYQTMKAAIEEQMQTYS